MQISLLLAFAGMLLTLSLVLAWILGITLFYPKGALSSYIVDRRNLLRAHIDYLMMAQFLMLFALLFRQYRITPPLWVVAASCYGAFFNPLGFLRLALTPKTATDGESTSSAPAIFPPAAAVTFASTTLGFLASVALVIRQAM